MRYHALQTRSPPGVRSPVETNFLGEVFPRLFLTCKTNVRKVYAHKVTAYHVAVIIILSYSPCTLLEWMGEWILRIVFHVRVVSEVAPALSWSLIRGGPPHPCMIKQVSCYPKLIPSPHRSRLCKARVAWVS